jgi:hypothetical protein
MTWLKISEDFWIGLLAIVGLLLSGALLLGLAKLWNSIREPYRTISVVVLTLTAWIVWNLLASREEKQKLREDLCKPGPILGLRVRECP